MVMIVLSIYSDWSLDPYGLASGNDFDTTGELVMADRWDRFPMNNDGFP